RKLVQTVYNPVVSPSLAELGNARTDHPWYKDGGPPVILSVGRLAPEKDFMTLINAFSHVRAKCDARLLILGEGKLRAELEEQIRELGLENHVSLHGFAKNPY